MMMNRRLSVGMNHSPNQPNREGHRQAHTRAPSTCFNHHPSNQSLNRETERAQGWGREEGEGRVLRKETPLHMPPARLCCPP